MDHLLSESSANKGTQGGRKDWQEYIVTWAQHRKPHRNAESQAEFPSPQILGISLHYRPARGRLHKGVPGLARKAQTILQTDSKSNTACASECLPTTSDRPLRAALHAMATKQKLPAMWSKMVKWINCGTLHSEILYSNGDDRSTATIIYLSTSRRPLRYGQCCWSETLE